MTPVDWRLAQDRALTAWQKLRGVSDEEIDRAVAADNADPSCRTPGPPHDLIAAIFADEVLSSQAKLLTARALQDRAWRYGTAQLGKTERQVDLFGVTS